MKRIYKCLFLPFILFLVSCSQQTRESASYNSEQGKVESSSAVSTLEDMTLEERREELGYESTISLADITDRNISSLIGKWRDIEGNYLIEIKQDGSTNINDGELELYNLSTGLSQGYFWGFISNRSGNHYLANGDSLSMEELYENEFGYNENGEDRNSNSREKMFFIFTAGSLIPSYKEIPQGLVNQLNSFFTNKEGVIEEDILVLQSNYYKKIPGKEKRFVIYSRNNNRLKIEDNTSQKDVFWTSEKEIKLEQLIKDYEEYTKIRGGGSPFISEKLELGNWRFVYKEGAQSDGKSLSVTHGVTLSDDYNIFSAYSYKGNKEPYYFFTVKRNGTPQVFYTSSLIGEEIYLRDRAEDYLKKGWEDLITKGEWDSPEDFYSKNSQGSSVATSSSSSVSQTESSGFKSQKGTFIVGSSTINVRSDSSTDSEIVASYEPGEKINYDMIGDSSGYTWISYVSSSGKRRYVAIKESQDTIYWGTNKPD